MSEMSKHRFLVTIESEIDQATLEDALKQHDITAVVITDDLMPALKWLTGHDTCPASVSMWCHLQRIPQLRGHPSAPMDDRDFASCYRMLRAIPGWRERIRDMHDLDDSWTVLVAEWSELERVYEAVLAARSAEEDLELRRQLKRRLIDCAWRGMGK
jgi:hypothetical protein